MTEIIEIAEVKMMVKVDAFIIGFEVST